jgi:pimeloyl-ACP methyl ester carboxylesterase/DNA-binding winged helix-turn-helix (wHTH) protein
MIEIGPFRLSLARHELSRDGNQIPLRPQAFDLLAYLAAHPGRLVTKDELLAQLWPNKVVEEAVVKVAVRELRKALADDARQPRLIETVHRCGYKLIAPVRTLGDGDAGSAAGPGERSGRSRSPIIIDQQIRFATAPGGVRLAYATLGRGPLLIKAANWLNHLDFDWHTPIFRHWLTELGRDYLLVRYDQRGSGLSDWDVSTIDFDAWVQDLECIVDAVPASDFSLLGISQGAAVAIAYAVRHPERVRALVLYGSYARGWARRPEQAEATERRQALLTLTRLGWGQENPAFRQVWTSQFIPGASFEEAQSFNELQRASTSAGNAARFVEEFGAIDVEALLPRVRVPTLVLHSRDDAAVPFDEGRRVAAGIPGARFVGLESHNHLLLESEPAWPVFLEEVRRFLGVPGAPR